MPYDEDNPLLYGQANPLRASPSLADAWQFNTTLANNWQATQRQRSYDMGLADPATGLPTQAGVVNAAQQYGNALMMGSVAPEAPKFDWSPGGGTKTAQLGKTEITYGIDRTGDTGEVILVKTPAADRGQGEARRAMQRFLAHADTQGTTFFLNADPMDKGVSKSGLDRFYRSLGFVKNMGKRKDFRSTAEYVRQPPDAD